MYLTDRVTIYRINKVTADLCMEVRVVDGLYLCMEVRVVDGLVDVTKVMGGPLSYPSSKGTALNVRKGLLVKSLLVKSLLVKG